MMKSMKAYKSSVLFVSRIIGGGLLVALLLLPNTSFAGPWSKGLGGVYAKLNGNFFLSDAFVNSQGVLQKGTTYFGTTTSLYFEVGLFKGLHIQGSLPYVIASNMGNDGSFFTQGSFGDGMLGFQYQLPIPGPFIVALVANAKLPLYDLSRLSKKDNIGANAINFPAQGDGQMDLTFWLSLGGSLHPLPLYGFLDIGYRHRTEVFFGEADTRTFADTFMFFGQLGYTIWPQQGMIVMLNVQGSIPFAEDQYTKGLLSVGLGLFLPVVRTKAGNINLELNVDPIIWSRNAGQGWGWAIGLSFNR